MFIDRSRDRPVRHLEWRVRIFGAGAILALVGMWAQWRWLITVALAVLLLGFLLRFLPPRDGGTGENGESHSRDTTLS